MKERQKNFKNHLKKILPQKAAKIIKIFWESGVRQSCPPFMQARLPASLLFA